MVASMVVATACSSDDEAQAPTAEPAADASVSVAEMVGSLSVGDLPMGIYFSFERYAAGSGTSLDGSPDEALTEGFVEGSVDATVGEPFGEALTLGSLDKLVIDPSAVAVTYTRADGVTLLLGAFDVDDIIERAEGIVDQAGAADTVTLNSERDGDFQRLSLLEAEPSGDQPAEEGAEEPPLIMIPGLTPLGSLAVSEDRLLVLPSEMEIEDALAADVDSSSSGDDDAQVVTAALDDAGVYAAFVSRSPVTPEGGEVALAGGFGTGFVDGKAHAYTVLVHEDEAAAEANGEAVEAIMAKKADCATEVVVQLDEAMMVASCPVEQAGWAEYIFSRVGLGPFAF